MRVLRIIDPASQEDRNRKRRQIFSHEQFMQCSPSASIFKVAVDVSASYSCLMQAGEDLLTQEKRRKVSERAGMQAGMIRTSSTEKQML
jgi:hypothetical protein